MDSFEGSVTLTRPPTRIDASVPREVVHSPQEDTILAAAGRAAFASFSSDP
jgi:hypothetical protein